MCFFIVEIFKILIIVFHPSCRIYVKKAKIYQNMFKPSTAFSSVEEERDYYKDLAAEFEKRYFTTIL